MKNVRFLDHPRYLGGSYRSEALKRDLEIRSSCSFLRQKPREGIGRSGTATTDETAENSNHQDYKDNGVSIRGGGAFGGTAMVLVETPTGRNHRNS